MLRRFIWLAVVTVCLTLQLFVGTAAAAELDEATRTVPLNDKGDTITLSLKQVKEGKLLFNNACGQCHLTGGTKTDPNINLDEKSLSLATPPRNNIEGLVDFLKNPTTFDGETEIWEIHPSIRSRDIFPEMRNLSEDDLVKIAGHILIQPKILGDAWGGGKAYR